MPNFKVEALDVNGAPYQGRVEADSPYAAITVLRAQGYHVHSVRTAGWQGLFQRADRPLTAEDLGLLSEQLATLVEGGLPLSPGLKDMSTSLRKRRLRRLLAEVQRDIENGKSLDEAFGQHMGALPPIFLSLVRAGEQTGNLPAVLRQLTDYTQGLLRLKYRLQAIFAYPTLLLVFLLFFFGLFVMHVLPQFADIYNSFGRRLPGPTLVVFWMGWFVMVLVYPLVVLGFFTVGLTLILGQFAALRSSVGELSDRLKFWIPGIRGLYRTVLAARFCRTLGILLSNGTHAVEAIHLAGAAAGNRVYGRAAYLASRRVAQGTPLSEAVEQMGLLKHSTCWMLRHGESNGLLEQTLLRVAETEDREAERREQRLLGLLGPGMVWIFGILVGFVTSALYLPILKLSSLVYY